mmetsp:Transcript_35338/g.76417  ORF Transcript_35338/g.76417 Transcript_35338/m.76417 type:complete len:81 (-) Transcript_35338:59-301(-)
MLGLFAKAPARTPHKWKFLNGFEQPCHCQIMMLAFGDMLTENPFCLGAAPKNPKTVQNDQNLGTTRMRPVLAGHLHGDCV